jgi:hypothetical protein
MKRAFYTLISTAAYVPFLAILFAPFILLGLLYADWKDIDSDVLN